MSEKVQHVELINRFVDLANSLVDEEHISKTIVSSALMTACAIYSSYVVSGNSGALTKSGVDKVAKLFGDRLVEVQKAKIATANLKIKK